LGAVGAHFSRRSNRPTSHHKVRVLAVWERASLTPNQRQGCEPRPDGKIAGVSKNDERNAAVRTRYAYEHYPEVAWICAYLDAWTAKIDEFEDATRAGEFSPEAWRFTMRRVDEFIAALDRWRAQLESGD